MRHAALIGAVKFVGRRARRNTEHDEQNCQPQNMDHGVFSLAGVSGWSIVRAGSSVGPSDEPVTVASIGLDVSASTRTLIRASGLRRPASMRCAEASTDASLAASTGTVGMASSLVIEIGSTA